MKRSIFVLLACLVSVLILSGCAVAPAPDHAVELALAGAIQECFRSSAEKEKAAIGRLETASDVLIYKAFDELGKASGRSVDPCTQITTNNDLQQTAMVENTKQIAAGIDGAKAASGDILMGVGIWRFADVLPSLVGNGGGTYNLTSKGDMSLTDSIKTSSLGDITGTNALGGILNPATADPFVLEVPIE
ncbi:MAG: hypothetical protein VR65_06280 [Desulfobulbaceae bacterium BRH_c16a]|nr:MAG: hypothetical protein VR65_06280 [Desulfobulbaceae bacterium BRH_c16a]